MAGLAGTIASALHPPLEQAHAIVQEFVQSGKISRPALQELVHAIGDARVVGLQAQQLGNGDSQALVRDIRPQQLDIQLSQALARQMASLLRHRVQLQPHAATATWVSMDGPLLASLIDAAIAWCTRADHRLAVSLDASGDVGTVLLRLRLQGDADAPPSPDDPRQRLSWHVLNAAARAAGVRLLCQKQGAETVLTLAMPRQHDVEPDPTPGDLLTSQDSLSVSDAVPLQHQRVLLITRHDEVRTEVEHVCASLGANLDWVATGAAAARQFAQVRADLVLIDERAADAASARLREQVVAEAPDFPWITLAQEPSSASLTQWMREDGMTLTNLRNQLAGTLLYGLSRGRSR